MRISDWSSDVCSSDLINLVREKAGLPTVQDSWTGFAHDPGKYLNKDGLREIIHQERTIELAFEGHRFWDLRRWKKGLEELNGPVYGWDVSKKDAESYYRIRELFKQIGRASCRERVCQYV